MRLGIELQPQLDDDHADELDDNDDAGLVGWRGLLELEPLYIGFRRRSAEAARNSMSPEHYVRPDDEGETGPPLRAWRRATQRLTHFLFNKEFDRNPPGIHPETGFNANGRRHS